MARPRSTDLRSNDNANDAPRRSDPAVPLIQRGGAAFGALPILFLSQGTGARISHRIREADLSRILAITNRAIAETTSVWTWTPATMESRRAWLRERRVAGLPVLVAEVDGHVTGFGSFGPFRAWEGYLHTVEHSLYVDPAWQRRGLGAALLAALEAEARLRELHVMVGGIGAENLGSLALHRRAGFEEAGRLKEVGKKFGRWLDLVFMHKILA